VIQIHIQQAIFSDERNDFSVKETIQGIVIPFLGTVLGSACVLFLKNNLNLLVQRILTGFAAGIMTAASVWSLLIPALEQSANLGHLSFLPSSVGFLIGIGFLLFLDRIIPHLHMNSSEAEGPHTKLAKSTMLMLAVTLHNIPEGMAVGVVYAGYLYGQSNITAASAMALSFGIAIQNFPEGAIISMPLRAGGMKRGKSFLFGVLSGAAEPIGAVLTIAASGFFVPLMPYMLSFAAGAMIYVVIEELIPEMSEGKHSNAGTIAFSLGFIAMMILDTVFQ
jgi:ZIP family zinc transporter